MPHIVFSENNKLITPSNSDGVDFNFIAKSYNNSDKPRKIEYKIGVTSQNKEFLLTLKDNNENKMIKADKVTRVTPVTIVKDALNTYSTFTEAKVTFSNTNNFNQKLEPQKEYLKDINYFVDEFKTNKEIQIEIGFGSGRHLLYQAQCNPDVQFIGLEIHTPSIEQMLKQVKILGIKNILAINYDARLFMEFIKSNSVGKIFVHFPVPWDKKPHRRVYSNEFIFEAKRVLKYNGTLELRTDSRKYFDFCVGLLTNLPNGRIEIDINKNLPISSKYEDRWKKQNKNIYDVTLYSNSNDDEIEQEKDFSFEQKIDLVAVFQTLPKKSQVFDDFFYHIEELFIIENKENSGLIQVTFGSFNRPVSKYLLIDKGNISYFQGEPIPTSSNIKAHNKMKEILR
ncbi:MAG: tRNA (guanosine(46)-N7)-methyltransferase TrmB [Arcobacter sp.]|uniref:tRNA (guanosine(46)-N7)-methyltransferase TrmB n=1 Tax=Arcobacter sp. TaxID=1872629 RepID=UPI003B00E0F4